MRNGWISGALHSEEIHFGIWRNGWIFEFDRVQFGEVDIDKHQDIASSVQLLNIPAVTYYRKGELIELAIGQTQDIPARIEALLAGPKLR